MGRSGRCEISRCLLAIVHASANQREVLDSISATSPLVRHWSSPAHSYSLTQCLDVHKQESLSAKDILRNDKQYKKRCTTTHSLQMPPNCPVLCSARYKILAIEKQTRSGGRYVQLEE